MPDGANSLRCYILVLSYIRTAVNEWVPSQTNFRAVWRSPRADISTPVCRVNAMFARRYWRRDHPRLAGELSITGYRWRWGSVRVR